MSDNTALAAKNIIRVECQGSRLVPLKSLVVIQNNLKSLSEDGYRKLRQEIIDQGFSFPLNVWKDADGRECLLDGTQRFRTVTTMIEKEGFTLSTGDLVPVSDVFASSIEQAIRKLLGGASQYGVPEYEGLYELCIQYKIPVDAITTVQLTGISVPKFAKTYFEEQLDEETGGEGSGEDSGANAVPSNQYILSVELDSEEEQQKLFEELATRGLKCKLIS